MEWTQLCLPFACSASRTSEVDGEHKEREGNMSGLRKEAEEAPRGFLSNSIDLLRRFQDRK